MNDIMKSEVADLFRPKP